jgi:hypothetical protein
MLKLQAHEPSTTGISMQGQTASVELRKFPYPYQAMMAICSDLDLTPDRHVYRESMRFLNTDQTTAMGPGADLEVGNSIYFDMPPNQFAYWSTDDAGRAMVRDLIHSGHIDCLHSYGDLAKQRDDAKRAIDELVKHNCLLEVWVDHSKAPSNFGPDIMVGSGDVVGSESYHADLTLEYGIRYVRRGRTTGVNGQDAPITPRVFADMLHPFHPLTSSKVMLKEAIKVQLGRRNHPRWEMYAANQSVRPSRLRDGRGIWEFLRSNPYWGGSGHGETAEGIGDVLTERMLGTLLRRQGVCILYTHLGKVRDPHCPFGPSAQAAFRRLANLFQDEKILVTTTQRLLRYLTLRKCLEYRAQRDNGELMITIGKMNDPVFGPRLPSSEDLQGLSFIVSRCERANVRLADDTALDAKIMHQGEHSIIALPWRRLVFPDL